MNQNNTLLEPENEFEAGDNKKYKVKTIVNNAMYNYKAEKQPPSLNYLV